MARDENNGELSFLDRFYYAPKTKKAWKDFHRSMRLHGMRGGWFAEKHVNFEPFDRLGQWEGYPVMLRYGLV